MLINLLHGLVLLFPTEGGEPKEVKMIRAVVTYRTLLEAYEAEYEPRKLFGSSESTLKQYRRNLRKFGEWLGHAATFDDLDNELIEGFARSYLKQGRAPETARKVSAQLVAFWNWAAKRRYVEQFPDVTPIQASRPVATTWSSEEIDLMFTSASLETRKVGKTPGSIWWTALFLTVYDTGARIGAILDLPRYAVNMRTSQLIIPAHLQKNRLEQSFVLGEETLQALQSMISYTPGRDILFDHPRWRSSVYRGLNRILCRAGIDASRRNKFHKWRRTVLTEVHVKGGDATELAGHSSPEVTRKSYLDPIRTRKVHPVEALRRPVLLIGDVVEQMKKYRQPKPNFSKHRAA